MQSVSGFFSDSNVRFQIRRYDLPVMSRGRSIFFHLGNGELTGSFIHRLPCISRFPSSKRTVYGKYIYIYIKTRIIKFHDSITTRDLRINLKLSTNFEYISPRRYSPIINGKKKKKRSIFTPQLKKLQYIDTSRQ